MREHLASGFATSNALNIWELVSHLFLFIFLLLTFMVGDCKRDAACFSGITKVLVADTILIFKYLVLFSLAEFQSVGDIAAAINNNMVPPTQPAI